MFELIACANAQIILAVVPENYTGNAYRIDLGTEGNLKTTITKLPEGSLTQAQADTPSVLNCTAAQDFWVQWTRTTITVGRGKRGINSLVTLQDNKMPEKFNEIAVTTADKQMGWWDVSKSEGM